MCKLRYIIILFIFIPKPVYHIVLPFPLTLEQPCELDVGFPGLLVWAGVVCFWVLPPKLLPLLFKKLKMTMMCQRNPKASQK